MNCQKHDALVRLARLYRVSADFEDGFGVQRRVSPETLLAVLAELGAPVESLADIGSAIRHRMQQRWSRLAEPVVVARDARRARLLLRLPAGQAAGRLHGELCREDGETDRWDLSLESLPVCHGVVAGGNAYVAKWLTLPGSLPHGYHRLRLETATGSAETLIIQSPRRGFDPAKGFGPRSWGVFLPLYALRSERGWGAGDFSGLAELTDWSSRRGSQFTATLPLLAAFLDEPCEPSPYRPVSRLFWNEFYLDPAALPEFAASPVARRMASSSGFRREAGALGSARLVDYRRLMALKRRVLEELAAAVGRLGVGDQTVGDGGSGRHEDFVRYVAARPELEAYARFRATTERRAATWPHWPEAQRRGELRAEDYDESSRLYHLYVQWAADSQMAEVAAKAGRSGSGLYLDLPLGVHPGGFDVWRDPDSFARGVAGGVPPDRFFAKGQNWGFAPAHPERIRLGGYRHFIDCLRHHMQYAKLLRVDHIMGLHRLYWIPEGFEVSEGVYVGYHPEELQAILALESHRNETAIIGEDLGTVPKRVRAGMEDHGFRRMYVAQLVFSRDAREAMRPSPPSCLACLNTHDMRGFAGFWKGLDIADEVELGLIEESDAASKHALRRRVKSALIGYLRERGHLTGEHEEGEDREMEAVLEACLAELAARDVPLLLVNLEDLWLEELPQNTPGTSSERPNWRRRARYGLEEMRQSPAVQRILRRIENRRRGPGDPTR